MALGLAFCVANHLMLRYGDRVTLSGEDARPPASRAATAWKDALTPPCMQRLPGAHTLKGSPERPMAGVSAIGGGQGPGGTPQ